MEITPLKQALDPRRDAEFLSELRRSAATSRMRMLDLGKQLKIRLHYGAMMSCVEILTALYRCWLKYRPEDPDWHDRDRFVLSKGHAAPALYVVLAAVGFFPDTEFAGFRRLHSILQGHPDRNKTPGVDCSTGSLGQGFPVACGMALGARIDGAASRVYTLISDGECNEGSVWEAALIASNLKLDNLRVLVDWNGKSSYGVMKGRNDIEPLADKWRAFGWQVGECDGHDFPSLTAALQQAEQTRGRPALILCHTVKGKGIPWAEQHHMRSNSSLDDSQYRDAMESLGHAG